MNFIFLYNYTEILPTFLIGFLLYFIGLFAILLNIYNLLVTMLSIELLYLGGIICFIFIARHFSEVMGEIYGLLLLIVAASESAVGLGILIVLFRFGGSITYTHFSELKG